MRFSTSINLFLALSISFLVVGNIIGMVHFAPKYFQDYVNDVGRRFPNNEYSLINAFIATKDFDANTIEEYRLTLEDLKNLTNSLESYISKDRWGNTSTFESLQKIGFQSETIREVLFLNSVQSFLSNITTIALSKEETPEQRFILRLLSTLIIMNIGFISCILLVTFFYTRFTFWSVRSIADRIMNLIKTKDYSPLRYERNDEFTPLVEAINILSSNLSRQERIRSDFLSDFSHEIKTPITALKMLFEGVEDGIVKLNSETLKIIHAEIERLLSTTNAILEYERIVASEHIPLKPENFNLLDSARDVLEQYAPLFHQQEQTAIIERVGKIRVYLEKEWVIRIFHNAFSNFAKYAGKWSKLKVQFYRNDDRIILVFADNGNGISKDQIPFVHEKFYQADNARSGDVKRGIGIGLSIIDKIARLHNGYMQITSEKNAGFTLRICLREPPSHIIHSDELKDQQESV